MDIKNIHIVNEKNIQLILEVIDLTDDYTYAEGKYLATRFDEDLGLLYIAVDNSPEYNFIIREFQDQEEAIKWLNK